MVADKKDGKYARLLVTTVPSAPRPAGSSQSRQLPKAPRLATTASPSSTSSSPARSMTGSANDSIAPPKTPKDRNILLYGYVSPNVTPRTISRRLRADSGQSTPMEVPNAETKMARPLPKVNFGLKRTENTETGSTKATISTDIKKGRGSKSPLNSTDFGLRSDPSPIAADITAGDTARSNAQTTPFFYANDAPVQSTSPKRPGLQKNTSSFFYADGQKEDVIKTNAKVSSTAGSQIGQGPVRSHSHDSDATSAKSLSPDTRSSAFQFSIRNQSPKIFRSPSPTKETLHLSYRKGASQIIRPNIPKYSPQLGLSQEPYHMEPDENQPMSGHGADYEPKSLAIDTRSMSSRCEQSLAEPTVISSPVKSPTNFLELKSRVHDVSSPTAADGNSQWFKDLAANARRERKLLDLEISNTSLLAINRSLEREVRKQKLDLRRLRRLSRATTARSSWFSNDESAIPLNAASNEFDGLLQDLLEEEDESEDLSDLESTDEGSLSPTALAESDARHRQSDARRLRLDLAKHKQLLIDSQKMNQSIHRCLGWTEQLIKEGNKALQYQVNVNELRLGGRVLSPEEVEQSRESYFCTSHEDASESLNNSWRGLKKLQQAGSDAADKDSGVDVDFTYRVSDSSQRGGSSTLVDATDDVF